MAPSRRRAVIEPKTDESYAWRTCPCLARPHSDGLCELNLWQGTFIDEDPTVGDGGGVGLARTRLLRPNLPVVKYKERTLGDLSGITYHLIVLGWAPLLLAFVAIYVIVVGVFALLYAACGDDLSIPNAKAKDYFNFSVQTMATIGYGVIYPKDVCSNWVVVLESFVSMIVIALMTGVAFAKFARPKPHVIFAKVFTVSQRESGGLEMRFRLVNGTHREVFNRAEILEVSFKLILMRIESTIYGEKRLCYYDLRLKTSNFITMRLEADIVHHIEVDSPFYGMSAEDIEQSDFLLILMMSGVDENLHDMIHRQYEYSHEHLRWGAKFVPVVTWDSSLKHVELDFAKVSATVAAPFEMPTDATVVDMGDGVCETPCDLSNEILRQSLWNVAGAAEREGQSVSQVLGVVQRRLQDERRENPDARIDYSDLESTAGFRDENCTDEDERKSVESTTTNSGSENGEAPSVHRTRFDRRSRTPSFRIPRINRPAHHHHDQPRRSSDQPMSIMRRRVHFRNHPFSRYSKGLYYRALETSWIRLFVWLAVIYFSAIAIIALLMLISSDEVLEGTSNLNVRDEYHQLFFFCAQTISTIGYGALSPNPSSNLVNFYVAVLAIAGVIVSTILTGLAWAKFSIPKATTVVFSDNILLTAFHMRRAIVFRAANSRTVGAIIEGSFRVSVVVLNHRLGRKETHELKLVRNVWPMVQLVNTLTHVIDSDSPLHNISTDDILSGQIFFVVLFTGLDSVVDNIKLAADGLHVDLEAINETVLTPDVDLRESRLYTTLAPDDVDICELDDEMNNAVTAGRDQSHDQELNERGNLTKPLSPVLSDMCSPRSNFVQMEEENAL